MKMNKEVEIAINSDYNENVETFQCLAEKQCPYHFSMELSAELHMKRRVSTLIAP
ncbi:hypothetical protein [Paenibacillus xylanilyticus]|uniref:hypothetical protein n=1 Tax=Paenibacillus xylanilyticus TaxID=248903 RepID=UPI0039A16613